MQARFGAVPTAALADVMDDLGLREQTLPPSISALAPGMRLSGQAFTVEGSPADHGDWDGAIRKTLAMLGAVPTGHVAVYRCRHERSAHERQDNTPSVQFGTAAQAPLGWLRWPLGRDHRASSCGLAAWHGRRWRREPGRFCMPTGTFGAGRVLNHESQFLLAGWAGS